MGLPLHGFLCGSLLSLFMIESVWSARTALEPGFFLNCGEGGGRGCGLPAFGPPLGVVRVVTGVVRLTIRRSRQVESASALRLFQLVVVRVRVVLAVGQAQSVQIRSPSQAHTPHSEPHAQNAVTSIWCNISFLPD